MAIAKDRSHPPKYRDQVRAGLITDEVTMDQIRRDDAEAARKSAEIAARNRELNRRALSRTNR